MRINDSTEYLLKLLGSESLTLNEIFEVLSNHFHCEDQASRLQLRRSCLSTLEGLYWLGIIDFKPPLLIEEAIVVTEAVE